jgi:hypothetical protein
VVTIWGVDPYGEKILHIAGHQILRCSSLRALQKNIIVSIGAGTHFLSWPHSECLLADRAKRCLDFAVIAIESGAMDDFFILRGLRFDWARNDENQDHVYSNQAFTHKLNEFGIPHEAEEYNGVWGTGNWGEDGRVYTEVLPFFARHLVFARGMK